MVHLGFKLRVLVAPAQSFLNICIWFQEMRGRILPGGGAGPAWDLLLPSLNQNPTGNLSYFGVFELSVGVC